MYTVGLDIDTRAQWDILSRRPHVFIAGALQCLAWLAALISLQRSRHPQHWLVLATWHLQPIALASAFLPKAVAGHVPAENIPLAVALGLEIAIVVGVDWQQAIQRGQQSHEYSLHDPLLHGERMSQSISSMNPISSDHVIDLEILVRLLSRRLATF